MVPGALMPMLRSLSSSTLYDATSGGVANMHHPKRTAYTAAAAAGHATTMGPITASVVLYVVERVLTRAVHGQLLRRGIARKIRRLVAMVVEWHVLYEVFYDLLEDLQ